MTHTDQAPDSGTLLSMQRTLMASDRTLMAWVRTALSLISFGFTLAKMFKAWADENVFVRGPAGHMWSAEAVGTALLSLGIFALVGAIFNHYGDLRRLRAAGLEAGISLTTVVAALLAIVGCMALLSVTVRQ